MRGSLWGHLEGSHGLDSTCVCILSAQQCQPALDLALGCEYSHPQKAGGCLSRAEGTIGLDAIADTQTNKPHNFFAACPGSVSAGAWRTAPAQLHLNQC